MAEEARAFTAPRKFDKGFEANANVLVYQPLSFAF
jgi:hypothetical protein